MWFVDKDLSSVDGKLRNTQRKINIWNILGKYTWNIFP